MKLSILKRATLAAAFCVVAAGQSAMAFSPSEDVNDERTAEGVAYKTAKASGANCPFATKVGLNAATTAARDSSASQQSTARSTNGVRIVQ